MPDLQDYKPEVSISDNFEIVKDLSDTELAFDLWKRLLWAKQVQEATFLGLGKLLKEFRDRKLYKHLDYDNFSQFLASEELSFSREKAYVLIRIYEVFVGKLKMNEDELSKMGTVRLMMLAPVIKDMSDEDAIQKIEETKELRYNDFIREVKTQTNTKGEPTVFWSEKFNKWQINYYDNITDLISLGEFDGL